MIMADQDFIKLFPDAGSNWEADSRWLILTTSISEYLSKQVDLPIDFQFQMQSFANKNHDKPRHAIGFRLAKRSTLDLNNPHTPKLLFTEKQKLRVLSMWYTTWTPRIGDYFTKSSDDLKLYRIIEMDYDTIISEECNNEIPDIVRWDRKMFVARGPNALNFIYVDPMILGIK